jgi:alpha-D-ribose 1-methylphosphonate 5-triphosphate synthase subunit PhnG
MNNGAGKKGKASRSRWMGVLANATLDELEGVWARMETKPGYVFLRRPETGLIMAQGRINGSGERFNLGETTVTRCTVKMESGRVGCGYVMGDSHRHAELAALFDGILQDPVLGRFLLETEISALEEARRWRKIQMVERAADTRVDFTTMVRGD